MIKECFISYDSRELSLAEKVECHLENHGLTTFLTDKSLEVGDISWNKIEENISLSIWFLVLISEKSRQSEMVDREITLALETHSNIMPILVDVGPERIPEAIDHYQALRLDEAGREDFDKKLQSLAGQIREERTSNTKKGLMLLGLIGGALWAFSE